MSLETWSAFLVVWILAAAAPGPNTAYTIGVSLRHRLPTALMAALGFGLAGIVHATLAATGLGSLLLASAELFHALKWLGLAYLVWLGVKQLRDGRLATDAAPVQSAKSGPMILRRACFVSLSNPKSILAYLAILPQFVDPAGPVGWQLAVLGATAVVWSIVNYAAYALAAHRLKAVLARAAGRRNLRRVGAAAYFSGAAVLAVSKREA